MTTLTYPIQAKRVNEGAAATDTFQGYTVIARQATINTARTGTAVGATTIPLFVAPAGSTFSNAFLDIRTAYDNTAGVNIAIGTAAAPATIFAATTVNTTGRRTYAAAEAQISANAVALTADTTVQAIVSITTSAVTTGNVLLTVFLI
jgi:hypothetical protein